MECWKESCKEEVEFLCWCTNPPINSCISHIGHHFKTPSESEHRHESLTTLPNQNTKKALIEHLHKSLSNLYVLRQRTINNYLVQMKLLQEKIKNSLNCFKEIIQKNLKTITEIKSIEIISKLNDNKINEILLLNPEESIEKLEDILECFDDEENFFIDQEGKIWKATNYSNQIVVFRDNTMKIVKTDLTSINYLSTEFNLSLDNSKNHYISMCLIPYNSIFLYGSYPPTNTAFIVDSNNNATQIINGPLALHAHGSIYYKDNVYIFGGWNSNIYLANAFKYNLKTKNWTNLQSMPAASQIISGIGNKNKILLSGYLHSKVYCYDIAQNSYTELHNVQTSKQKIVCGNNNNYYVIETGGNIYESNYEWKVWNTIGSSSNVENRHLIGFKALWKNKVYFAFDTYNLYEFDLKEKKVKLVKKI